MAGRHSFAQLRARMTPEARHAADDVANRLEHEMELADLRRALRLSQAEVGDALQIRQGSVAKIERRTDMHVSTLRRFIEAMGGELELVARFPDQSITIRNIAELPDPGQA